MKMKLNTIKSKIVTFVLLIVAVSFISLGVLNTYNSYNTAYEVNKKEQLEVSENLSNYIDMFFKLKLDAVKATAKGASNEEAVMENDTLVQKLKVGKEAAGSSIMYYGVAKTDHLIMSNEKHLTPEKNNFFPKTRKWYINSVKYSKGGVTEPYVSSDKVTVVSVYNPVFRANNMQGVIGANVPLKTIVDTVLKTKIGKTGYAYIVNENGKVLVHKNNELLNKKDESFLKMKTSEHNKFKEMTIQGVDSFVSYSKVPSMSWYLVVTVPKEEIFEKLYGEMRSEILLYIGILLFMAFVLYFFINKLLLSLAHFQDGLLSFFSFLNKETTDVKLLDDSSTDEIGIMSKNINENIEKVSRSITEDNNLIEDVKNIVNEVGQGYLKSRISKETTTESLNELKNLLNDMLDNLESLVGKDLNKITRVLTKYSSRDFTENLDGETSGEIGNKIIEMNRMITEILQTNEKDGLTLQSSSKELTTNVNTLSNNATKQAASLEETAASIDEITSNIEQTSQKAQSMSSISSDTKSSANEGQKLANDTVKAIDEINATVISISESITVIDQIAFQTNILSLNAAVEAATAGEAGKGFAVVAQEVRNLASRSAEAARDIKELVESATEKANNGKSISTKMIEGFNHLEEKITETNKLIDDVTHAAREQSIGMVQISDSINKLDSFTQENASVADNTNTIAQKTNHIASEVVENVNKNNFNGKGAVIVQTETIVKDTQSPENKSSIKQIKNSPIIPDDEWENF